MLPSPIFETASSTSVEATDRSLFGTHMSLFARTRLSPFAWQKLHADASSQLVCWAYAWASSKDDRLQPASENLSHLTTILLDTILASPTRLDALELGVSDLIACTADRLSGGEEIERDNSGLLWRLIGADAGRRRRSSVERPALLARHRFSIP